MKIVAIPRNGIGNRLQMLASAYILARNLSADLEIHWTKQAVFRSSFNDIFEEIPCASVFEDSGNEEKSEFDFPQFTNYEKVANRITMKNLRLGDQYFMPELKQILSQSNEETELWIESGEKFNLGEDRKFFDSHEFRAARLEFYNQIKFNPQIIEKFNLISKETGPKYWAVHIRGNDRNSESISNPKILNQLAKKQKYLRSVSSTVFIASDDVERGQDLATSFTQEGYKVIFDSNKNRNRLSSEEAQESVVDWLGLKNASSVVSYGGTTYSYEAVVAGNSYDSRIYLSHSVNRRVISHLRKEALFFKLYGKVPLTHQFVSRHQ
jgi:hypothetical protein